MRGAHCSSAQPACTGASRWRVFCFLAVSALPQERGKNKETVTIKSKSAMSSREIEDDGPLTKPHRLTDCSFLSRCPARRSFARHGLKCGDGGRAGALSFVPETQETEKNEMPKCR